ncbi:MAG: hypothetical protein HOZ81_06875 [Streptomyces sp.]|nr:hypothetical protein [Streptomyces sp.]
MVIDAQSIDTSTRKCSIMIDTTGLLLTALVTAASVQDSTALARPY